jgi:hypothetical protein
MAGGYEEGADAGAAEVGGYSAAAAAHTFQEFLEGRLSRQGFEDWLRGYPYGPGDGPFPGVEDEINRATLALRNLADGDRTWEQVHRELLDARSRLSGLAYSRRPPRAT